MSKVVIIGAGLAGSLLAIYLAKRGIAVDVYESRGDMRLEVVAAGRSINLALSDRGIAALREVGMDEYMLAEAVPMTGRMIHAVSGETKLLPYSGRQGEYINSVSRTGLNIALINEADKYDGVKFHFNERCVDFDCKTGEAKFSSGAVICGDTVIATDGAGSAVRHAMMNGGVERFDFSQTWLEHGYKELHIPPRDWSASVPLATDADRPDDRFLIEKNALHIWPRNKFMMIALPNFDDSFTCTLFLAHEGENSFEEISRGFTQINADQKDFVDPHHPRSSAAESILAFFDREFPDAVPLMPTLTEDFFTNPTGNLGTVKCFPWNAGGKALLLGDSAHAVVPFYGQGMNCAFEDVRTLDQLIEKHGTDWETVYSEYGQLRKINTDAIADMAEENFYEMRDSTADPIFVRKRELETKLEQTYPDYFSKYSMVTFRDDLPYSVAKEKGNAQDRLLMQICSRVDNVGEIDTDDVITRIRVLGKQYE
jgi:kynurenine 3-monooxygenase